MDDGRWECDDLPQLVEEASTASMEDLPTEAQQSVSEACQEAGIDLRVMRDGYRHVTPEPLLDPKADAELLAELAELERMMRGVGGFEDVQGEHCNQQHIDGCPNRFKQHDNRHAREGKTKPQKQQPVDVQPKGDRDKKKREKRAKKLSRTPEGKALNRMLESIDVKSDSKNYSGAPIRLNDVSSKTRARIKKLFHIDTKGWFHSISEQQIRHIQSGHSKEISRLEYQLIPEIQKNWNQLMRSEKDPTRLIFTKRIGRKKYTLVESIVRSKKGGDRLEVVTFYSNKVK